MAADEARPTVDVKRTVAASNGLILPFGLGLLLWIGWRRRDLLAGLRQPVWLLAIGTAAFVFTVVASVQSLATLPTIFQ